MDIMLQRGPNNYLIPADQESLAAVQKWPVGQGVLATVKRVRNYKFLKKMHCLFKLAYDFFCEHGISTQLYKGQRVMPSYDRFRYDLVILAGHYTPVFNIRGELRLEAKSISYAKCSEEEAEKIYSSCIDAALKNVYRDATDEKTLREMVERVLSFT